LLYHVIHYPLFEDAWSLASGAPTGEGKFIGLSCEQVKQPLSVPQAFAYVFIIYPTPFAHFSSSFSNAYVCNQLLVLSRLTYIDFHLNKVGKKHFPTP